MVEEQGGAGGRKQKNNWNRTKDKRDTMTK